MRKLTTNKESTLQLRLTKQQKEAMTHAAKIQYTSLSQFVLENAYNAAQEILADQNHFLLPEAQWILFCKALDAPARPIKELRKLLNEESVLDGR